MVFSSIQKTITKKVNSIRNVLKWTRVTKLRTIINKKIKVSTEMEIKN